MIGDSFARILREAIDDVACLYCPHTRGRHGRRYVQVIGWHDWTPPHEQERANRRYDAVATSDHVRRHNQAMNRIIETRPTYVRGLFS